MMTVDGCTVLIIIDLLATLIIACGMHDLARYSRVCCNSRILLQYIFYVVIYWI